MRDHLKWCVLAALPILILSLAPQARLWLARGSEWQGAYATVDGDEFLYSAYVNALIDGRPRRNDPFSGRDDHPNAALRESAFSIQFLPPFLISSIAKIVGLSASTTFIILIAFSAGSAAVTLFWLLMLHTNENRVAALGSLFVLLLGTSAAGQGILASLFTEDVTTLGLAFLRRYQPAAAFFLFFVFCALVHCALTATRNVTRRVLAVLAGATLGILIFSYLYLWTAAAVWVVTFVTIWFYLRPGNRWQTLEVIGLIVIASGFALVPYIHVLSNRAQNLDETQTLLSTHRPDFFRVPELLGVLAVLLIWTLIRRKRISPRDPSIIFAMSIALLPVLLFNQQIVTGRSMQPFHYQYFIVNYTALVALVILAKDYLRAFSSRRITLLASAIVLWGVAEVGVPTNIRVASDIKNDQIVPVLRRLKALSATDGTLSDLRNQGKTSMLVFSPDLDILMMVPTWTVQGTMVGIGGLDFGSATIQDRKVFVYLYYSGVDTTRLAELLQGKSNDFALSYYARAALFGHERVLPQLSLDQRVVQDSEIQEQLRAYDAYVASFSQSEALKHPFGYVVVPVGNQFDFSRIDRWYEREPAERVGQFDLYRVKSRS